MFSNPTDVHRTRSRLASATLLTLGMATGCVASINEVHHIATFGQPTPSNPTGFANVLRVKIDGETTFTNVRYIAGTYNEQAADLFLNNAKASAYDGNRAKTQGPNTIFNVCVPAKKSGGESAKSLGNPNAPADQCLDSIEGETFLIIMSTNADAIAETISAFAESTATIKSVNYLLNRDVYDSLQVAKATESQTVLERKSVFASLKAMFNGYETRTSKSDADELAILQALAVAIDPKAGRTFTTLEEAKIWFAARD